MQTLRTQQYSTAKETHKYGKRDPSRTKRYASKPRTNIAPIKHCTQNRTQLPSKVVQNALLPLQKGKKKGLLSSLGLKR